MTLTSTGQARQGVFISYARSDGETAARELRQRLLVDAPDVQVWLDRSELEGGIGWWSQIEQQLDQVEFLVIVMTPAAMRSPNTRREWRAARQRGVCVYPVKAGSEAELDFASLPNWMRKANFYDPVAEWPKLIAHLRRGCRATRVPFMAPSLSSAHVRRPRETAAVLQALQGGAGTVQAVALRGAGGYGKTTLAAAVCHEDSVIEAFDDGILWVTLGQSPNLLNELLRLYAALTGERPGFVDVEDAALELSLKLDSKNCLIVIDDVWKTAHALPFLRGARGCTRLITTRLAAVVPDALRVPVEAMAPDDALGLLFARIGEVPDDPRPFAAIVARLGAWPLPIKLAGARIRQRIELGDTALKALDYIARALDKRGIVAFDEKGEDGLAGTVEGIVEANLRMLDAADQQACIELGVFGAGDAIPMAAAAALWQLDDIDSEDRARRLDNLSLIELDLQRGTIHLHDLLRGILVSRLQQPEAVHARLLRAWGDAFALPHAYAWRRIARHLQCAGREDELLRLLFDMRWLEAKLGATDVQALMADLDQAAPTPALAVLRDAMRLSVPALAADPMQLRTQLLGRLTGRGEPEIATLLQHAAASPARPWLRLRQPTLDAPGGLLVATLVGHERAVTALCADAAFERLVSGSNDATARAWRCSDGQATGTMASFGLGVRGIAVYAEGRMALIGSADGRIAVMDLSTQQRVDRLLAADRSAITALAVSADGSTAFSSSRDGLLRFWDVAGRTLRRQVIGHEDRITSVALSADGRRAVSGSDDGTLKLWDVETASCTATLRGHSGAVNTVALTGDGRLALSGAADRCLMLWDVARGAVLKTLGGHASGVAAAAMTADGRRAISGGFDGSARLWDLDSGKTLAVLSGHSDTVHAVAIDASGLRAATGSADRSVKLWRLEATPSTAVAAQPANEVVCLVADPQGRRCAAGSADGRIVVRDIGSGEVVRELPAHANPVLSLGWTEDGSCVLSGDVDRVFCFSVVETGERFVMPVRHLTPIIHFAYSAVARYLMTAGRDHFLYLWDVPAGTLVARYGTRRLFDHLIAAAPRRSELPATEELLDTYLADETIFDVVKLRLTSDGRHAVISALARDAGSLRATSAAARVASEPAEARGSCLLVFNLAGGEVKAVSGIQPEPIGAFAVDPAGTRLIWARSDHRLELWDLDSRQRVVLLEGHTDKVADIAFSDEGGRAFSCGRDRTLRVWDLASGRPLAAFTADAALRSLALDPCGDIVVVADALGRLHSLSIEAPARAAPV